MPRFPVSDHCDGARFFNLAAPAGRSFTEVLRWMRTRERTAWPKSLPPLAQHHAPPSRVERGQVAVTFIGHSTFLVRTATRSIITDPVFTTCAGPFGVLGPRRVRPPAIPLAALPPVDLVLLSHNHYDHLQPSSLRALRGADVVTALGVGRHVPREVSRVPPEGGRYRENRLPPEGGNYRENRVYELDWWQQVRVGDATVTAVPAQHFSARTPWDRNATLWCGFVVDVDGVTIYFAGDSGYSAHFAEIGERFPAIDVALIPIGAYEPRWFMEPVHMNPDEAVRAHVDVRARLSIGMHFGTFQLTDEAIDEPLHALVRARVQHDVSPDAFRVLDVGETVVVLPR